MDSEENIYSNDSEGEKTTELDPIFGEVEDSEADKGKVSEVFEKLKSALKFSDNEWIKLAIDLVIGKVIMDYK